MFVITVTYAPSAAASDARSEAAGDAGPSSRPSDNADEAAPPAPGGLVGPQELDVRQNINIGDSANCNDLGSPPADVTVITNTSTKHEFRDRNQLAESQEAVPAIHIFLQRFQALFECLVELGIFDRNCAKIGDSQREGNLFGREATDLR